MKKIFVFKPIYLFWMLFLLSLVSACQKDKEQNAQPITFKPLEYLNSCNINLVDRENSDTYLIINSQEELNRNIVINQEDESSCIKLKSELIVDFDKWTILIGKKRLTYIEGELIKQSVHSLSNDLVYKVSIKKGGYTAIGQFRFGVIIPKISNDTNVMFDIKVE